jgi:hypothetical protein
VLFFDGADRGIEKDDEAGVSSLRVEWDNDGEEGKVKKGLTGKEGEGWGDENDVLMTDVGS